ncbi:unnamed protein product [Echinostoma caproni]|uniref:Peptidase_S9 domain-containing protein n=1 Tax=Echinostoma caproni TaxID=27848 RepID=A0A183A9M8_9TREM|nr:unnamed protein product [Echinostoma caproni]
MNDSLFEGSLSHLYAQVYSIAPVEMNRNTMRRLLANDSARTLSQVRVSANGLYFTTQWYTGYEAFGASAIKEAPTRQLINHLTGTVTNVSEYETTEFVQAFRMDPDAGLALWYIEPGGTETGNASTAQVYLIWHSHLLMVHSWDSHHHSPMAAGSEVDHLVRVPRAPDTQTAKSAKQHQAPTSTYRMKVKERFLNATQSPLYLLHPSPPFGDRPVSNVVLRLISFSPTKKRDSPGPTKPGPSAAPSPASNTHVDWDSVASGALVRLWFPPYLNERHLKSYSLMINVSLSENYHYIERNRTALIGSPGLPSHMAGLILSSDKAALNPSCEYAEAVRLFGSQDERKYYEFDLTKLANRYRNKELLIVHASADTTVPFAQTMKFLSALIEENIDVNFYPLYDRTDLSVNEFDLKHTLLTKLSSFLLDCLSRTGGQHSHFLTKKTNTEFKESPP